jgi:hypothetical protein
MINSNLFSRGHPLKAEPGLTQILKHHKKKLLLSIRDISDLDKMTDLFLERLVKEAIVEPLVIQMERRAGKQRTEQLDVSSFPSNSMAGRMRSRGMSDDKLLGMGGGSKQVVRISIPFTGDPCLPTFAPETCSLNMPRGEVIGQTIQFDVIFWGADEDSKNRASLEITENCEKIVSFAGQINEQVRRFNETLPQEVTVAFTAKLDELTKQRAILADLGIPEKPDVPESPSRSLTATSRKPKEKAGHIIQFVENQFVQQLNQTNYNAGDVNNAIQSDEQESR